MAKVEFFKGIIKPFSKVFPYSGAAADYFAKLSDYGRKKDCILLESADIVKKYGEKSIGSAEPCIKVKGRGEDFEVIALNSLGERFLDFVKNDFGFAEDVAVSRKRISGKIIKKRSLLSEKERLREKTHADVLRLIAFKFRPQKNPFPVQGGLFGVIGYDFIDQFEDLPVNERDSLGQPDYEMNFYDNIFLVDHGKKKIVFVANAFLTGSNDGAEKKRCEKVLQSYAKLLGKKSVALEKKNLGGCRENCTVSSDVTKENFMETVEKLKEHILAGDVFQVVLSKTITAELGGTLPLDVYSSLKELNPSPYMFYFNNSTGILLGSSPETFLKIEGKNRKTVEIRPIAGTTPRGIIDGQIDSDLDSRYEVELKLDKKELAEHTMLVDLARNDVARICEAGTRHCTESFTVEKYSHVQHLVSTVSGTLKKDYDALHAYLASMNMGTLTGAPKVEAMKLIRLHEAERRGFYGGSIGYLTPSGDFDSAIIIRSMSIVDGKAHIRSGAGIVYDSVPEKEFEESEKKARACLAAIELAKKKLSMGKGIPAKGVASRAGSFPSTLFAKAKRVGGGE